MAIMQKLLQDTNFLGNNIQRVRLSKGMKQKDVARELQLRGRNMAENQYGMIEQGRRNIYVSDLLLLQQILKVDISEFFRDLTP